MKVFGFDQHQTSNPWDSGAPSWAVELGFMLGIVLDNQETIMSTIADLTATLDSIGAKVTTVKTDVETLLAKLAAVPTAGLTPEQQTALDAAVVQAQGISDSLTAVDKEANPPAA